MVEENKKSSQVVGATSEVGKAIYDFDLKLNKVSIGKGIQIDGVLIHRLLDVTLNSGVSKFSTVTLTFYADVAGLDDI